ncbi:hypothetical protein K504DRAFT_502648 [Pleomassaria siparia CBS 279.74]|uniref:Uncharacterized protein n=1 Tax=Pleomassaria siparia CBS 279.74 TaxID=1314801 RepID=A0A6G1K727_9PLEO|nr:hypothetical protein K504DRAFT_502648 [Pleomassaria siparia CBS 279.74]
MATRSDPDDRKSITPASAVQSQLEEAPLPKNPRDLPTHPAISSRELLHGNHVQSVRIRALDGMQIVMADRRRKELLPDPDVLGSFERIPITTNRIGNAPAVIPSAKIRSDRFSRADIRPNGTDRHGQAACLTAIMGRLRILTLSLDRLHKTKNPGVSDSNSVKIQYASGLMSATQRDQVRSPECPLDQFQYVLPERSYSKQGRFEYEGLQAQGHYTPSLQPVY